MEEKEENRCYYSRKLATFPSVEAVVMQFIVSLSLYNQQERKTLEEITFSINQKLQTNNQFKTILKRVIPSLEVFQETEIESVLNSFLQVNDEIVLGFEKGFYFVKEYGKNYEKIEM